MRTLCTALVMMTTVLIVHVTASIITCCFRVHQSCRMSERAQEEPSRPAGTLDGFSRRRRSDVDSNTVICPSFVNHNKVVHVDGAANLSGPEGHRTTQATDFKYSETNVQQINCLSMTVQLIVCVFKITNENGFGFSVLIFISEDDLSYIQMQILLNSSKNGIEEHRL